MSNKDFQEMTEFFKERNLTVPSVFKQFADAVVQEPGMSRWRIGEPPVVWPFASLGESGESLPNTIGSFTKFVSVGFTLHEPWDEIDDEYGDALIDFRLVTRGLLMELRISEGHNVLKGGGNAWNADLDSEWIPFWNEMMRDLTAYAKKFDLFAQFDNFSEAFVPEHALCFDPARRSVTSFTFGDGVENLSQSTYVDGPPALGELLRETRNDDLDNDNLDEGITTAHFAAHDLFEHMDRLKLEVPFYAFELSRFLVPELRGKGWRHVDGPDITPLDDYLQRSFELAKENPISPHFALNFAGHGVNSYSINTRMVIGPILVVAQYGWGGVYMNHNEQRAKWNNDMDALYEFFNEIDMMIDIFEPPAPRDLEVAIQYSDFRGTNQALIDQGDGKLSPIHLTQANSLESVLNDVLKYQQPSWGLG